MSSQKFDVSVLIVTYKTKDLVLECVKSCKASCEKASLDYQAVVVDNASGDGTVEALAEQYPDVRVVDNQDNLGPAKAYNQALRLALDESSYVLLLNSDIMVWPETIGNMYRYLTEHSDIDGVCGDLLWPNGKRQKVRTHIWSLRKPDYSKAFPATFVGTTFSMIRPAAFEKVGLYDENYYFYNEDLDWAERAVRAGLKFTFLPGAKVYHYQGQGSKQNYSAITRELYKSNLYYFRKFYHPVLVQLAYFFMLQEIRVKKNRLLKEAARAETTLERKAEIKKSAANLDQAKAELIRYKKEGKLR